MQGIKSPDNYANVKQRSFQQLRSLPLKRRDMGDLKENAMQGGVPVRLRGLKADDSSISPTMEEVVAGLPEATITDKGLAGTFQSPVEYVIKANESVDIEIDIYGMFIFVSKTVYGTSLLMHKGYYKKDFKILLDPTGIIGHLFSIEQLSDGGNTIRVCSLLAEANNVFSINRI